MDYRIKGEKVRKVYKVPILGKWLQVLDFFRAIPARFQDYDQKIEKINETCVSKNKFEIKMNRIEAKIAENDKLGQSIEELEQHFSETIEAYEKKIHLLTQENEKVKEYCRLIEMSRIPQSFEQILGNQEWLCKLNLQLSIHPTIWEIRTDCIFLHWQQCRRVFLIPILEISQLVIIRMRDQTLAFWQEVMICI